MIGAGGAKPTAAVSRTGAIRSQPAVGRRWAWRARRPTRSRPRGALFARPRGHRRLFSRLSRPPRGSVSLKAHEGLELCTKGNGLSGCCFFFFSGVQPCSMTCSWVPHRGHAPSPPRSLHSLRHTDGRTSASVPRAKPDAAKQLLDAHSLILQQHYTSTHRLQKKE